MALLTYRIQLTHPIRLAIAALSAASITEMVEAAAMVHNVIINK